LTVTQLTLALDQRLCRTVLIKGRFVLAVSTAIVVFASCLPIFTLHRRSISSSTIAILHNRHSQPPVNPARRSPVTT
jgi:hypothetical protein